MENSGSKHFSTMGKNKKTRWRTLSFDGSKGKWLIKAEMRDKEKGKFLYCNEEQISNQIIQFLSAKFYY